MNFDSSETNYPTRVAVALTAAYYVLKARANAVGRPMPNYTGPGTISRGPSQRTDVCLAKKKEYNLGEAAEKIGVGRKTARRLCLEYGCGRYSCGAGDEVIVPGKKSKRQATKTRMTWKITDEDIAGIRLMMRGGSK